MTVFTNTEITIVLEHNVYGRRNVASVWVAPGFYNDADDDCPTYDEIPDSVKMIGPVDIAIASEAYERLIGVISACGFQVSRIVTADD